MTDPRQLAQRAMADLKSAVRDVLPAAPTNGLTVVQVDRSLGLNQGYPELEGLIAADVLGLLEEEGTARKTEDGERWMRV